MSIVLNQLSPAHGSNKKFKRMGRGIGSGKGKTCGRGGKGQTARSGVSIRWFEGGQNPIFRRLPMRGFRNFTRVEYEVIGVAELEILFSLMMKEVITLQDLRDCGVLKGHNSRLKILVDKDISMSMPIKVQAHGASRSAVEKVRAAGGEILIVS